MSIVQKILPTFDKKSMQFSYEIDKGVIYIFIHDGKDFDIDIQSFWRYIKQNDMNNWLVDYHDATQHDGHGQVSGTYSFDEYFDLTYETIKADLEKYLYEPKFKNFF